MSFFNERYAKVDRSLMEDGAEVDFGGGFFVKIRHVSARKVEAERTKKVAQMKIGNRNKQLDADQNKDLMNHVVSEAGIVSWRGGDAPEFSPELARQIFDERPEFLEDVLTAMTSYETFREELVDETLGNSEQSSNGDSNGETTSRRSKSTKVAD